ncbi:hypothetical protein Tco_0787443 [Tanacetum coccineum]
MCNTMAETMEQYMSKTRADYGSGVARPKIKDKDNFELKGQFLKELRTNIFSGSDHEDANEHIEKVDEKVILFYNGLGIPTRHILDSRGAIPSKTIADAKVAIQEMAEYSQKWHNGTSRSRRENQGDDLMPTIKEGEVIEEFRTKVNELDIGIDDYPSYCNYDKKIHIDCAHNLKFSCMIGFEFTHANFFPLLYVNVMSKRFHNSIIKDKMVYKGNNVVGALMNVLIFVGTFSVVMDFAVIENIDAYRDERMGDVIFGEPFLREVGIKTKRFKGIITIYNGDDEVTYQMVRSHPRFKRHTNEQCNKIPPLLKVRPRERNIDEYWWRIYKSGDLEVLES